MTTLNSTTRRFGTPAALVLALALLVAFLVTVAGPSNGQEVDQSSDDPGSASSSAEGSQGENGRHGDIGHWDAYDFNVAPGAGLRELGVARFEFKEALAEPEGGGQINPLSSGAVNCYGGGSAQALPTVDVREPNVVTRAMCAVGLYRGGETKNWVNNASVYLTYQMVDQNGGVPLTKNVDTVPENQAVYGIRMRITNSAGTLRNACTIIDLRTWREVISPFVCTTAVGAGETVDPPTVWMQSERVRIQPVTFTVSPKPQQTIDLNQKDADTQTASTVIKDNCKDGKSSPDTSWCYWRSDEQIPLATPFKDATQSGSSLRNCAVTPVTKDVTVTFTQSSTTKTGADVKIDVGGGWGFFSSRMSFKAGWTSALRETFETSEGTKIEVPPGKQAFWFALPGSLQVKGDWTVVTRDKVYFIKGFVWNIPRVSFLPGQSQTEREKTFPSRFVAALYDADCGSKSKVSIPKGAKPPADLVASLGES